MMSKTTMPAAFTAILALAMPAAFAQTTAAPSRPPANTAPAMLTVSSNRIMPGQIRATEMDGASVYDINDQNIGDIKDIVLDKDGRVAAVVLNVGSVLGVGGRLVAVSMNDIGVTFDPNHKPRFAVNMTEQQLKSAQAFQLNQENNATGSSTPPTATHR